jgi:WD40 repeat protein
LQLFDCFSTAMSRSIRIKPKLRPIISIALSTDGGAAALIGKSWNSSFPRSRARTLIVRDTVRRVNCLEYQTDDPIEEISISPDGRRIAMTERYGLNLRLFDRRRSGSPVELKQHDCRKIVFSPRSSFLASVGLSVMVWDVETCQQIAQFRGQDEDVPDMAFSPDERILAVARTDGAVEFWDFRKSRLMRSYSWDIGRLSAIAFAPDGLTCAVAGQGGKIVVWDVDA